MPEAAMATQKPRVLIVLGGPGSGKGTQSENICKQFGFKHISAGDCLREETRKENSKYKEEIERHIVNGTIVPVEITCALMRQKMNDGQDFLVDGFPRNIDNLNYWIKAFREDVDTKLCLFLDCSEECMEKRLLNRGETSGRTDDNAEAVKKRFRTFNEETKPVLEYFKENKLYMSVDAERDIDSVWKSVKEVLDTKFMCDA
eukprot:Selendium_serpulae@DN6303_c0_g1_i2.p1